MQTGRHIALHQLQPSVTPIFHQAASPAWWNGDGLNLATSRFRGLPRDGSVMMQPNSETRGIYLARTMDGELTTDFDSKRVRKAEVWGEL